MKNLIFLIAFLVSANVASAQTQPAIIGKWKITNLSVGLQHDYKTKKTILSKELEALKKSDKEEDKFAFAFTAILIETFEDLVYVFETDDLYEEIVKGKAPKKGNYKLDWVNKKIKMTSKNKFGTESTEELGFEMKDNILMLNIPKGEETIGFTFEKVK